MVAVTNLTAEQLEFRQEALVEEIDGTLYLVLHGQNDNDRNPFAFKRPFDPKAVNGFDDGDPHFL